MSKEKKRKKERSHQSSQVRLSGLRNPGNFSLWNPPARALDLGISLRDSGFLRKMGIQNTQRGIQNPTLIRFTSHGATPA